MRTVSFSGGGVCYNHAATPNDKRRIVAICVGLIALTWFVFGQTLHHDFFNYDDNRYVYENPEIAAGLTLHRIPWAFTYVHSSNWHPLTWISHMLDCRLFGLKAGGHHFTNVLLHTSAAILLFFALREMTGALWRSAFVAAVFAIHPLRVESVAWISERKDVLSGVFFMLTLLAYARYVSGQRSVFRYLLVVFFFALGLMAKPMLVTLPCVLLLLDYWPLRRFGHHSLGNNVTLARRQTFSQLVAEKIPLFFMSIGSCFTTWWAQRESMRLELSLFTRIENALVSYARYLGQLFWPVDLAPFYPHPREALPLSLVIAAALLLIVISAVVLRFGRKLPYLITGWGWYLIMLVPVIGLVQVGAQALADRYTYLPQIGIVLGLTWTIVEATAGSRLWQRVAALAAVVLTLALAWRAHDQTRYWRNSEALWLHTLAVTKNNDLAHNSLGHTWGRQGRLDSAIGEFQAALKIAPESFAARYNLAVTYIKKGEIGEAIREFERALSHDPKNVQCRTSLAAALQDAGRTAEAVLEYQKALELEPGSAERHCDLGNAYLLAGRPAEAIAQYKIALQVRPGYANAEYSLGAAEMQNGNRPEAIRRFENAVALAPNNPVAHNNLAVALLMDGRDDEAIPHLERCLALQPSNAGAHNNLAQALAGKQKWNAAIGHWRKSLQIDPRNTEAQTCLAWTLATAPDSTVRNGAEALALARHLSQTTKASDPMLFRVLAAAYAEAGQFAAAIETARRGIDRATAQNRAELAVNLQTDLDLFNSGQPLRDASKLPATR